MARSNGPYGPAGARPPARRHPGDDPFAAQPNGQAHAPNGQWPAAPYPDHGHAPQHGQGYHFPPEPETNFGYGQPGQQPYDRYQNGAQQPYPPQQQWSQQQPDPRGYDLGSYMPSQPYPQADHGQFQHAPDPYQQPPEHFHQGADPAPFNGQQRHGYADPDAEYDEEFTDGEEPRSGRRWIFIAAIALVGAVGVGGAVAYTYKSLSAPPRVPIVTKDAAKDKMAKRLADTPAPAAAPSPEDDRADDSGGPRKVKTIAINPNAPQPQVGPPPSPQVAPSAMVPGIMLDNVAPRPQQLPPQQQAKPQAPPRVVIGTPPPHMAPPPQNVQPQVEHAPPPQKKVAMAPPPPPPAAKQPAKHAPAPAANHGSGYVAVLSSQKSRMDALKVFADLQQKYPDALNGKVPDVQEKDLSERNLGTMFRLVVGPPGSRAAASAICSQLKTAGHEGCWVTEF